RDRLDQSHRGGQSDHFCVRPYVGGNTWTSGEPYPGERSSRSGTPPRTVPRLVKATVSRPLPGPPSLVTAIANVFGPSGFSTPFGTTNVCWGPTLAMYWPMFQPLTKIRAR